MALSRDCAIKQLVLIICLLVTACSRFDYQPPPATGDGWEVGTLAEAGLDEQLISQAVNDIESNRYRDVHSLLIIKDGKLVFEAYFPGYVWDYDAEQFHGPYTEFDRETMHTIMSVTKAFTSALVGIAVEQGVIAGVQDPVFDYFPQYAALGNGRKEDIALEHLLTMTSGLEWNEWEYSLSDTRNDLIQLWIVEDPVAYILAKPLTHTPGTYWYYSGGDVILLSEVIQEATGQRMDAFAAEHLFAPLGITVYEWDFINEDTLHASGNLKLRPRDMAKLGYLILNNGKWHEQQILSTAWVEKTLTSYIATDTPSEGESYTYQWWIQSFATGSGSVDALHRSGWGGQDLYLFPDYDLVVAFTGGNYETDSPNREIVERFILPAVR